MIARVALPLPIDKIFSYALPGCIAPFAKPLSRIRVPFNNRSLVGFILSTEESEEDGLKAASELVDCVPLIDDTCAQLCLWASRHYVTPIGLALKYALSSTISIERHCLVRTEDESLSFMDNMVLKKAYDVAGKEAVLDCLDRSRIRLCDVFTGKTIGAERTERRTNAYRATLYLGEAEDRRSCYISLISQELKQGRNVLMLLPDYQVVGDFFYRAFTKSFPGGVLWFHSSMTGKKRAETYFRARSEKGRVILGHRSSVFLPLVNNGLIIVERPEEDEYRNKEAFKFNAVRVAMKRAEIEGVPLVLGSIAPPVEAMKWAAEGLIDVREGRPVKSPPISSVRSEKSKGREAQMPEAFVAAVTEALEQGGNVVIHTPRRAYVSSLYCGACGHWLSCPGCLGASLSYNRTAETLTCNTCKCVFPYEEECTQCRSTFIRFLDVGAEYVEARLREAFPDRRVLRITGESDTRQNLRLLGTDGQGGVRGGIIVGTHVLSKLYALPTNLLILYGWEDFLRIGGYRAREKMYQVFMNLVDALRPQNLLLYTYGKEPFDISLFLDRSRFYTDELQKRQIAEFPPYVRFFLVSIIKRNKRAGQRVIKALDRLIGKERLDLQMLGPIDVKGRYGWKVILKGDSDALFPLLSSLYCLPGVHIEADPPYL
jgi:primosomal protein N' (replication factor Y)